MKVTPAAYEAIGLICILVAVCITLTLFSYNPTDTHQIAAVNPFRVKLAENTHNVMGAFGAHIANALFLLVGYLAYMLPCVLGLLGVMTFSHKRFAITTSPFSWLSYLGYLLFIISSSGLLGIHVVNLQHLPLTSGGIIGATVSELTLPVLGLMGTTIIFLGLCIISIGLLSNHSWLHWAEALGNWLLRATNAFNNIKTAVNLLANKRNRKHPNKRVAASQHNTQQPNTRTNPAIPLVAARPTLTTQQAAPSPSTSAAKLADATFTGSNAVASSSVENDSMTADWDDSPMSNTALPPLTSERNTTVQQDQPRQQQNVKQQPQQDATSTPAQLPAGHVYVDTKLVAYTFPAIQALVADEGNSIEQTPEELNAIGRLLEQKLLDFGVAAKVVDWSPGPVITRYELQPAPGTKAIKITNLARDLARSLAVMSVRVVEVIPGRSTVGVEIPNKHRKIVRLHSVLDDDVFAKGEHKLPLALGHDIEGKAVIGDLAKMPHLLAAGTTGSGKSVGINAMLVSLLYRRTPQELRLLMVDPKMLELAVYNGIPHLLTPVITDMKDAANGLRWCVAEMERRYKLMSHLGVRNIEGFNIKVDAAAPTGGITDPLYKKEITPPKLKRLPFIVVVIDEFADMMIVTDKKKVEELISRIAQKARAAGIHLILATQRPSVDVITGLIKANIPSRIAYQVSSKIDSRTILDQNGAEQLLGHGDMLYFPSGANTPSRVHGAFVSDDEVHAVVENWRHQGVPEYVSNIISDTAAAATSDKQAIDDQASEENGDGALYQEIADFIVQGQRVSISLIQRKFNIGYNRSARIIEQLEENGIVGPMGSNSKREILIKK